jgi:hypothetical protein
MSYRNLSISIDGSTGAVTFTPDADTTVFNPATGIVCRFADPGQSSYPRVVAVLSGAGGGTNHSWTLNAGYWESPSITSAASNGSQYTQYTKIHVLVRKSAESEETSTHPFVGSAGLQPILRDPRIGMTLVDGGAEEATPLEQGELRLLARA